MSAHRSDGWVAGLAVAVIFATATAANAGTSLLIYPNISLKWNDEGNLIEDTLISLGNEFPLPVTVLIFMVNGDEPTPAVFGPGGVLIERAHPGWNRAACQITLGGSTTKFWSAATGSPGGCPFGILDAGDLPGRPDPENPTGRMLRGFMYVWAVNNIGQEINWNFLNGDATITNFKHGAAWSYQAQGFRALLGARGDLMPDPGVLNLNGVEYERAPATLSFSFFAAGAVVQGGTTIFHDTALTLMPVSQDFRQDGDGPINTKARFSITNMNGTSLSGTERCITCWDQLPLSKHKTPNHFLRAHLGSDLGTAVVEGLSSFLCGPNTQAAALVGVGTKITAFTTADWNQNGIVDVADFRGMTGCLDDSGPYWPPASSDCLRLFDFNRDGVIDMRDVRLFPLASDGQRSYSTVTLSKQGSRNAVIKYDAPAGPEE
jgi:hypothetical protein